MQSLDTDQTGPPTAAAPGGRGRWRPSGRRAGRMLALVALAAGVGWIAADPGKRAAVSATLGEMRRAFAEPGP